MEFIINNWYIIVAGIAVLAVAGVAVYRYFGLPSDTQLAKVREWLLWAVTEAEKELGGGTGKLKLRQVYDLFVTRFPWLAKIVSFELFSDMVDDALDEMREMLANNQAVKALVNGEGAQNE
ncbi:hypothetical protein [uncultured Oscillibacter sp.]|jgi:hypothetical protein|uniref:hypothetical protein n=1 Tax=uncultured Oscillibacter sp. TaxID=876091 RepID=UPI002610A560|nr:hypothetical protein [uncultured Oscillibacter sp.]